MCLTVVLFLGGLYASYRYFLVKKFEKDYKTIIQDKYPALIILESSSTSSTMSWLTNMKNWQMLQTNLMESSCSGRLS